MGSRFGPLALLFSALAALGLMQPQTNARPRSKRAQVQEARVRNPDAPHHRDRDGARFEVSSLLTVAFVIIGLIVTVAIIDGVDGEYYNQTDNITTSMSNASFTDPVLDNLTDPLSLLVGVALLLGIVIIILGAIGVV